MGLFGKFKSRLGMLRTRASSIGARLVSRLPPRTRAVLGRVGRSRVARAGLRVGKLAFRFGRIGTPIGAALTALTVGSLALGVRRRRREKKRLAAVSTVVPAVSVARRLPGVAKLGLIAAGIGAAAFVGEQIAERLGVRGGAGFIGRRPREVVARRRRRAKVRRKRPVRRIPPHRHKIVAVGTRRRKRRGRKHVHRVPRHRGHKRVSFTTKTGQKVSFLTRR